MSTFRCSDAARSRGDAMLGTASPAAMWLLVERSGAWPRRAMEAFEPALAAALSAKAERNAARVTLIRSPGKHPREEGGFRWAVASARLGQEGIRWHTATDHAELVERDWTVLPGEGEPVALVCSHSRHDVCCAVRGRPVAAAGDLVWPGRVWECSHVGGDRFAATMVLLPQGVNYGQVEPSDTARLLTMFEDGKVDPAHLRGRSSLTRFEQAAQGLALTAGLTGSVDGARPQSVEVGVDGVITAVVREPAARIVFREVDVPLGTRATCHAAAPGVGREYELLSLERL
ncbi:MAG: sucrase ferredoxin [Candidatus Nanopelagicales bacterium]